MSKTVLVTGGAKACDSIPPVATKQIQNAKLDIK